MSTRRNNGSHYENHQRAAELQDLAAHAHRTAQQHGKEDHATGHERSRQSHEHSQLVHQQSVPLVKQTRPQFGDEDVAELAYALWQERGCPDGSSEEDWFRALEKLRTTPHSA